MNVIALIEDAETGLLQLGCKLPHSHPGRRNKIASAVLEVERVWGAADPPVVGRGASARGHPNAGDQVCDNGIGLLRGTEGHTDRLATLAPTHRRSG